MEQPNPAIEESWKVVLGKEFGKTYMAELKAFLVEEKKRYRIFPPGSLIFNAFNQTPFGSVKVVILGQDPIMVLAKPMDYAFRFRKGFLIPLIDQYFQGNENDLAIPLHGTAT